MNIRILACVSVVVALFGACGDDSVAGKGVITETTNGTAARGAIVTENSLGITGGEVIAVFASDVPEAWNGGVRARSSVTENGFYRLSGLPSSAFDLFAKVQDTEGHTVMGKVSFVVRDGDTLVDLGTLVASKPVRLEGRFEKWDSVQATLAAGEKLRATVRGTGSWVFLDSLGGWRFEGVAPGWYKVRIQKVDGIAEHETTLRVDSLLAR